MNEKVDPQMSEVHPLGNMNHHLMDGANRLTEIMMITRGPTRRLTPRFIHDVVMNVSDVSAFFKVF